MRLFFALWPNADVTRQLSEIGRRLNLERDARRVEPKNYHVTLAFVGEVPATELAVLQHVGRCCHAPQFTLTCDSIEFWREPRVVVAAAQAVPPALLDLWSRLNDACSLPHERLRAHVTLARKVAQAPVPQAMSPVVWRAETFSLVRSDTGGAQSAYTVVDTWPLLDKPQDP